MATDCVQLASEVEPDVEPNEEDESIETPETVYGKEALDCMSKIVLFFEQTKNST